MVIIKQDILGLKKRVSLCDKNECHAKEEGGGREGEGEGDLIVIYFHFLHHHTL